VSVIPRLGNVTYCKVTSDKGKLCYIKIYLRRIIPISSMRT